MELALAALRCSAALLLLGVAPASCSSTENPHPAAPTDAGAPGVKCLDLVRECHYVDFGDPDQYHECHNWGHEGPESMCAAEHDRCVSLCEARQLELGIDEHGKPLDAGTDGHGGSDTGTPDARSDAGSRHDAAPHDSGHVTIDATPIPTDGSLSGAEMCVRLGNICHKVDPGSGPIHECHNIGHDGVIKLCEANYARCIPLCTKASP